ncbi:MAG: 50S ribosomal protein L32e [Candidatus Aenigmatarchaeota archaeon]
MVNPRKKPEFKRWLSQTYKRLKSSWRRPRGIHSKIRIKEKSKIKMPSIGYRAPKNLRYLHPSGFREVLVRNLKDLEKINPEKEAIKIAHTVGKKKRAEILKKAEELKIKVLNV